MKLTVVTPRATEKAYRLVTGQNTYVFDVPLSANKNEIKAAVETQFDGTKVASIKTLVQSGKSVRFSRGKNRYPGTTTRQDSKKAYVTLSEGRIKVFEQDAEKEEKK
jgi:large subunit ribosomal protein L23